MALTKPKLSQNIDTDISVFTDPILVLHQGSTLANVDTGFLFNRANGLVNNVAIYWSESTKSFITAFTDSTGAPDANVNVVSYANLRANVTTVESIYTTSGVYWSANGQAWSSGGGAFSRVAVTGGNTIQANAEGLSTITLVGGSGISILANPDTDTITFTTVSTAESIWVTDHDSGLVTEAVVLSEDNGLVADGTTDEYDLGTITITGVVTGDTIAVNSMPGDRLITGTDISVGNITAAGDLTFTGTGERIRGDFSNNSQINRLLFQTSTLNSITNVGAIPNGTSNLSQFTTFGASDPSNTSAGVFLNLGTEVSLRSAITGTGTYIPLTFHTGGSERIKIDAASGNVVITSTTTSTTTTTGALVVAGGIGVAGNIILDGSIGLGVNPGAKIDIKGLARSSIGTGTGAGGAGYAFYQFGTSATATQNWHIGTEGDGTFRFYQNNFGAGTERVRITNDGHFVPAANVTYDLGSTTLRWRNIYTGDLNLSNGRGDYTIVEGEDDLFLYNNRTGKTYKFVVQEVDPSTVPPKLR